MRLPARAILVSTALMAGSSSPAQSFALTPGDDVSAWQVVLDGVMGGRSSGRVSQREDGILTFTGSLSLENNGGFSQMRRAVDGDDFAGATALVAEVRGDGRTWKFDVRQASVRMMAGAYQQDFETVDGEWIEVSLPLDGFQLYSFGRKVSRAPAIDPTDIESLGFTLADKQAGPFRLDVRAIRAVGPDAAPTAETAAKGSADDLVSVAKAAGLNTLLTCVTTAGLELPEGPVTIFAPTDAAFAKLPEATVEELLSPAGRGALTAILTYHVVPGVRSSAEVLNARSLPSLNGQPLTVDAAEGSIAGASIVAVDVPFDGGVVHVIDSVMLPEQRPIAVIAAADERLTTLLTAVKTAGLARSLDGENGPWTVFAPVDSAFAALPEGTVAKLLKPENRQDLTAILGLHVVPGRIAARELLAKKRLTSFMGQPVEVALDGGRITVGGAGLVATDIQAANGVIHLIDTVLLLTAASEPVAVEATANRSSVNLAGLVDRYEAVYALAVERGAPRFNAGDHETCAELYELAAVSILSLAGDDLPPAARKRLVKAVEDSKQDDNARDRSWTLRRGLDSAFRTLQAEAAEEVRPGSRLAPRGAGPR